MNYTNSQKTITGQFQMLNKLLSRLLVASLMLFLASCSTPSQPIKNVEVDPILHQATFNSPEEAADTLAQAVKNHDQELFNQLLGNNFRKILPLADVTPGDLANFNKAWGKHHSLLAQGDNKMLLAIGKDKWTLPIPIVSGASGWYFDIQEGLERIRIRRIGRNELATMQTVLAYYDAQLEYAEQDRNDDNILTYAQKFISIQGSHDGLYWEAQPGEPLSPLGSLLADRTPGGGYHGYYYRILNAQGKHAKGGARSYLIGKNMRAGFALIAWPEKYAESGIMSFIVSHEGIVYEQNLGSDSTEIAEGISTYDPDINWVPVKEVYAPSTIDKQ